MRFEIFLQNSTCSHKAARKLTCLYCLSDYREVAGDTPRAQYFRPPEHTADYSAGSRTHIHDSRHAFDITAFLPFPHFKDDISPV